jgi:transcriptional regulator with XRE-family HTH domain
MNHIGELLISYRTLHGLTQKNMVEELSHYSDDFKALNTVTLSRWETGTTSPGLNKKKTLLKFFASGECLKSGTCHDIVRERYEMLRESLSSVFTRRYQYLIGNFPEFELDEHFLVHNIAEYDHIDEYIDHLIEIEITTNPPGYYDITHKTMKKLCQNPSTFAIVCERKNQHLGHFVMFKVRNEIAEAIAHNRRSEFSITTEDLCNNDEQGSYYIHALYGRNPKIAAILNVKAYLHLFENLNTIDNIVIFSSRQDGVLLTKDYGIGMVAKGKDEQYGFDWYGMLSPVEDILFSDTVVKLIF